MVSHAVKLTARRSFSHLMRESDVNFSWIAVVHHFVNSTLSISFLIDFIRNNLQNRVYSEDSFAVC